jgi:carbon-monoxide dehydrogenase small subunit
VTRALDPIDLWVNGKACSVAVHPMRRLLDVLREDLALTGTKEGCGEGECGACAVLVEGRLVDSCLVPVAQVRGCEVTTIEGLAPHELEGEEWARATCTGPVRTPERSEGSDRDTEHVEMLAAIQQAFAEYGGAQCGICTPGMILAARELLDRIARPSEADVREALAGNICRCTGYIRIFESVLKAVEMEAQEGRLRAQ